MLTSLPLRPRALTLAVVMLLAVLVGAPTSGAAAASACTTRPLGPSRNVWFGVNLDWGNSTLKQYSARLGRNPAVAVSFSNFPLNETDTLYLDAAAEQVRLDGGVLISTLQPTEGLAAVTPSAIKAVVSRYQQYNRVGVPVIVRYAHEMNGSWYPWSQDPDAYIASFRAMASAVHSSTTCTAMAWAPNYGGGYPFTGGRFQAPNGSPQAARLDTNGDGVVSGTDDPYLPYYPGDDVVDWVGLSLYHWGARTPWGDNAVPEPGKYRAMLQGTYNGTVGDETALPDFYAEVAQAHGKPLAIFETGALYTPDRSGPSALEIKRTWWRQVFDPSNHDDFPLLRMINWFEWDKYESETRSRIDWTVTQDPAVRAAFRADLPSWLIFGTAPVIAQPKKTITCAKGAQVKRVVAVNPKCPTGWKLKRR